MLGLGSGIGLLPKRTYASKAEMIARRELTELMEAVGLLPSELRVFWPESLVRQVAERMAEMMMAVKRGEMTVEQALDEFDCIISRRHERPQLRAV
jgi:hypothetical protein